MKKFALCLMATGLLLTSFPYQLKAETEEATTSSAAAKTEGSAATKEAKEAALTLRLNEIKAMDKSELTSSEKAALRKEVRTIKQEYRRSHGGLYISVGTALLIVLLLVILL